MKILQFSGGIDSLATLFVKRPEWPDIVVCWINTGSAYPDMVDYMQRIALLVPHFEHVRTDKAAWEGQNGTAVDLLPVRYTLLGRAIHGTLGDGPLYTSYLGCCNANIWTALAATAQRLGATHIIRGQKKADVKRSPINSGHVEDGITYEFPIEDWTREQVFAYCERECPELIPAYYRAGEVSSHDCWDCIAYLDENGVRIRNLPTPDMQSELNVRLRRYREHLIDDFTVLGGLHDVH